jgi:hypothetical protein
LATAQPKKQRCDSAIVQQSTDIDLAKARTLGFGALRRLFEARLGAARAELSSRLVAARAELVKAGAAEAAADVKMAEAGDGCG